VAVFRKPCEKKKEGRQFRCNNIRYKQEDGSFQRTCLTNTQEVERVGMKIKLIHEVRFCQSGDREGNLHMVCDAV